MTDIDELFETLYRRHKATIYNFIHDLTGKPEEAEALMRDAFLRAYHELPRLRPDANAGLWLYSLAYRTCREAAGQLQLFAERLRPLPRPDSLGGAGGAPVDDTEAVRQALPRMPLDLRACLLLREREGLSYEELGDVLGLSWEGVKLRLLRAREFFTNTYRPPG